MLIGLVFTLSTLFRIRSRRRTVELAALLTLLMGTCLLIFGDLPLFPIRLHVLAFAVLPFVMWAAIGFGIGGASLSVFLIATVATLLTALGSGPFSGHTAFVNARASRCALYGAGGVWPGLGRRHRRAGTGRGET
jgi:integral membrane sensor domain MASE1